MTVLFLFEVCTSAWPDTPMGSVVFTGLFLSLSTSSSLSCFVLLYLQLNYFFDLFEVTSYKRYLDKNTPILGNEV